MEVQFKKTKTISSINVRTGVYGSFALDKTPFVFENCRERFAVAWDNKTKGFFFRHVEGNGPNVAAFIIKTEQILKQKRFSQFALTNWEDVLWVEPSMFWKSCPMRRSLFTILLRAGAYYNRNEDNYETAIFRESYLSDTRNAVKRFLYGYTKYVGEPPSGTTLQNVGWKYLLGGKNPNFVKERLIATKRKKKFTHPLLKEELWA